MKKHTIVSIAFLALAIGFGVSWIIKKLEPATLTAATWFGDQPRPLPEFELVNQHGDSLHRADLLGQWHLIFFGYTHCPDVCPTSLQTMTDMVKAIEDSDVSQALKIMFVSVDPQRDKPELLKNYLDYFNPDFIGATGTTANLDILTRSLGIVYYTYGHSAQGDKSHYEVAHSASFVLLNPSAQFVGLFSPPHTSQAIAKDLDTIIQHL